MDDTTCDNCFFAAMSLLECFCLLHISVLVLECLGGQMC